IVYGIGGVCGVARIGRPPGIDIIRPGGRHRQTPRGRARRARPRGSKLDGIGYNRAPDLGGLENRPSDVQGGSNKNDCRK
ncbi:MAG: hypothetical protein WBO24_15225, partial [Nitrospirales bacterium]